MPNYKIGDVVDLDDVLISPAAYASWQATAAASTGALAASGRLPPPGQIPTEQGLWLASGELEIFVEIPGVARISMTIPPGQWAWARP